MKDESFHKKALEVEFGIKKIHAERGNGLMQCDCCLEYVSTEYFDLKSFLATRGTLLCDLCGSDLD